MSSDSKTGTAAADGAVVFLGLGANLGDRAQTLQRALAELAAFVAVDAQSHVYDSEPFGVSDQPRFLNMVVRGHTRLEPVDLLHAVKDVERRLGRVETIRMGPRVIDIDVLFYGGISLEHADLVIPHPGIMERPFVLIPLLDIDPDLRHPVTGTPLQHAVATLGHAAASLRRVDDSAAAAPRGHARD